MARQPHYMTVPRFLITVGCYAKGASKPLWEETAYRDAKTPKAAAVAAGMPATALKGYVYHRAGLKTLSNYYTEPLAEDGTRKVWYVHRESRRW